MFNKDVKVPLQEAELVGTSSSNIAPRGVGIHVVEDHDVAVVKAGDKGEMGRLVHVQCVFQIDDPDENIMCNNVCSWCEVADQHCHVGGDSRH